MFGRQIEPTTRDIIGALADHGQSDETDKAARMQGGIIPVQYGPRTQDIIVARTMALAQSVREAEDRAAVKYAAEARIIHSVRDHLTSREAEACTFFQEHMQEVAAIAKRKRSAHK